MALPTGRLTFGQIRDLALRKAGNPQLLADAGAWLSQLLYDLYTQYEWPFLNTSTALTLTGATFPLPSDFLKAQDDNAFAVVTFDGVALTDAIVFEKDRATFDAVTLASLGAGGRPKIWCADRGAATGLLFPNPSGHLTVATLRYKALPVPDTTPPPPNAPLANDALVPVFPYHFYLVQALTVVALEYEQDPRVAQERQEREALLVKIRGTAMPLRSQEPVVPLDPEVFGTPFRGDEGTGGRL